MVYQSLLRPSEGTKFTFGFSGKPGSEFFRPLEGILPAREAVHHLPGPENTHWTKPEHNSGLVQSSG